MKSSKLKLFILIILLIFLNKINFSQTTEPTNFIDPIIQFEKNVSKILKNNKRDDSITINKKKLIKKFITDSLKSAYFAALNTAENDLDEITNASGNDIPTQGIRIAMQKLFNELKSSATTRRQIVIRFELKKDELDYFGKELDNFVCPEFPNPGDEKRIGNKMVMEKQIVIILFIFIMPIMISLGSV